MHTRYVCDFSGLTNFSQKLWNSKKTYRTLFSSLLFLLLTHDEFFDAFQGKKFRLQTVCLFQRLIIEQFIRKVVSLTTCLLVGFWESCELLHLRGVISFFLCFRSELATEVVVHGIIRLDSKIRSQNVQFHDLFWRGQNLAATNLSLSFARIDFAALISSRALRFFSGRITSTRTALVRDLFLMVFQGNCARGRTGHMTIIFTV